MTRLRLATCNISGLRNDKKRRAVFEWLRTCNYDVIFMQETHCHLKQDEKRWGLEWDGQSIWSRGTSKSRGVCVLFNKSYKFEYKNVVFDPNGRYIVFDLHEGDVQFRMINIYAPNDCSERIAFMSKMQDYLVVEHENVIAGDFNCTLNSELDRKNCIASTDIGKLEILSFMSKYDLEDVWRRRNPSKMMFSWKRMQKESRIDYWLISKSLDNQVNAVNYKTCVFSDHNLVELELRTSDLKRGPGIWKMNVSVIKSKLFQDAFHDWWELWKKKKVDYNDISVWWDLGKRKIKNLCIDIAKLLKMEKDQRQQYLEKSIFVLESKVIRSELEETKLGEAKSELKGILHEKGEGAKIRSRIQWFEEGEKSTKYFYGLEKRNAKDKLWDKIIDNNGNVKYGTHNILNTQIEFYSNLYKKEGIDTKQTSEFLSSLEYQLDDQENSQLEENINISELTASLKMMKNNKSPGSDGIVVEFYKMYWHEISQDLLEVYHHCFTDGKLTHSQDLAILRLIFKNGAREKIENWRPISLLNIDAKLLSKVLAERLKIVLPRIIHLDQKGCVKGRFIGHNIRLIEDMMDSCENEEVILLLDQQKAFDRVEHDWLFLVLDKFGFGDRFKKWLKILYRNMQSAILTNGVLGKYFKVERGIRQGDSLSALLYIIQSEPFNAMIRKSSAINGITVDGFNLKREIRSKQYVDDTFVCLRSRKNIPQCLEIITKFENVSGSKLNKEKTMALVVNNNMINRNTEEDVIKVTEGPEKVLGILVGNQNDEGIWQSLLERVRKKLDNWKNRNLSLDGKVNLIKSLGMSTILHVSSVKCVPESFIDKIDNLFYKFLWDGKKNKIRKEICVLPKNMGGIGMIDIRTVIKVQRIKWILRILNSPVSEDWNIIPYKVMHCLDNKFNCTLFVLRVDNASHLLKDLDIPLFYKQCIDYYQEFCRKGRIRNENDIIWCNSDLLFNSQPLAFSHWAKSNILFKKDIVKDKKIDETGILQRLLNKAPFIFDCSRLKASIPQKWYLESEKCTVSKDLSFEDVVENILNQNFTVTRNIEKKFRCLSSKDMYNILLLNRNIEIKSKAYWQLKLDILKNVSNVSTNYYDKIDFECWFEVNFSNSLNPRKCNDFNWKLFHGKIMTEKRLLLMKYSDGMCSLCNKAVENLEHLLIECEYLGNSWNQISYICRTICDSNFEIDDFVILCGVLRKDETAFVINMILSTVRFVIWRRRNYFKYEKDWISADGLFKWVCQELKDHVRILSNNRLVVKNIEIKRMLRDLDQFLSYL